MGHNLASLGTASLDTYGGLITFAEPRDVPEGASCRTWDTDFEVGSVKSRPGLESMYTYATTLLVTGYSLTYGLATFTYVGPEPTVNEGFLLSGFTGPQAYLNGLTVYVESVNMTQFTAAVNHADDGPVFNLSGSAVSVSGLFVGPNLGSLATSTTWTNKNNIFSSLAYASVSSSVAMSATAVPTAAVNSFPPSFGPPKPWTTPANVFTTGASVASVTLTNNQLSDALLSNGTGFAVPANATITGISVVINGKFVGSGVNTVFLQLATNGTPVGTPIALAFSGTMATYTKGGSAFQWGTTFTPATVNGNALGVILTAGVPAVGGVSGTFSANALSVTVYYTTASSTGTLLDQGFAFAISLASGISGL